MDLLSAPIHPLAPASTPSPSLAKTHTKSPTVTGSSVLGIKYNGGVMIGCDTLASYGSMAKYRELSRLHKVGDRCVVAATGELSDYQYITELLDSVSPAEIHQYLTRVFYNRRNKMDPLWNYVAVAGCAAPSALEQVSEPFLGVVDLSGTFYIDDACATGFGNYIAMPLLRKHLENAQGYAGLSADDARRILIESLTVLFYRDCRTSARVQLANIPVDGPVEISDPFLLQQSWEIGRKLPHE